MKHKELTSITLSHAKEIVPNSSSIAEELLLFDKFEDVPIPTESRRMQCLFVALCTEGRAQYTVDTIEHSVQPNDIIVITEGQVVGNYMLSRDCHGIAMMCSNNFFHELIKEVHEISSIFLFAHTSPVLHLNEERAADFVRYFREIKNRVDATDNHFRKELVMSLLKAIVYDIGNEIWQSQQFADHKQTRAEVIFTQFIQLVEQNFRTERRVAWYGERLCITPKYLSEAVKAVSKRTPNDWIDNYVVLEMRVQLKNSTKSVKEIAEEMNFQSQSFFGKYFKDHVGMSPSKYRKS